MPKTTITGSSFIPNCVSMRVILYFLLLLLARPIWAQTVISGKLIEEEQQHMPGVSVIYKKVGATVMNGFGRTGTEGLFKLQPKLPDADSIQLDFNHMSYAKKTVVIANQTA